MRRQPDRLLMSMVVVAITFGGVTLGPTAAVDVADDVCARMRPGETVGAIGDPELTELSGLVASRAHPPLLWAHNDSGDTARVDALGPGGDAIARYTVDGAAAIDWEDIAIGAGPEPARSYLYIGDIGDNDAVRDHVTVYRVAEPEAAPSPGVDGTLTDTESFTITYPDGPQDAEAMFVDPVDGALVIVTKVLSGESAVFVAPAASLFSGAAIVMTPAARVTIADAGPVDPGAALNLPGALVTAADISPDGGTILLRTYQQVLAFHRPPGSSIGDALAGEPCRAPVVSEPQGEAIAFRADGGAYVTAGETQLAASIGLLPPGSGSPLTEFVIDPPAAPNLPATAPSRSDDAGMPSTSGVDPTAGTVGEGATTQAATTLTSTPPDPVASTGPGDDAASNGAVVAAAVVGATVIALGMIVLARRRRG